MRTLAAGWDKRRIRLFHSRNDLTAACDRIIINNGHTIGEQVNLYLLDSSNLGNTFSTWALQEAQDIPVTSNFCFITASLLPHPRGEGVSLL